MAKRKAAKSKTTLAEITPESVEPLIVSLAGQLGSLLGKAQGRADGWLESLAVRQQVSQIRDGATQLLQQVNKAGAAARKKATGLLPGKKAKKAKRSAPASKSKGRSGGTVDAPGKRHRKPPPEELFDPRLGEPMGKQMGQKNFRRGRGDR